MGKVVSLILILFFSTMANAGKIAILKSKDLSLYAPVITSFSSSFHKDKLESFIFDGENTQQILKTLDENDPDAFLILGSLALDIFSKSKHKAKPAIFALVSNPDRILSSANSSNTSGISINIPAKVMYSQVKLFVPNINCINRVAANKDFFNSATENFIDGHAKNEDDVVQLFKKENSCIASWLLPDPDLISNIDFQKISTAASESNKALIVFSQAFVKRGGFMSVSLNYKTLGQQAASLLMQKMSGKSPGQKIYPPIGTLLVINKKIAKQLGFQIPENRYRLFADIVVEE